MQGKEMLIMGEEKKAPVCRSVFSDGSSVTTCQRYTEIWVRLIHQMEKSKETLAKTR